MEDAARSDDVFVVTFLSTHQALKCERALKPAVADFRLIPVPRQISASCGLAARVAGLDAAQLQAELKRAGIEPEAVYRLRDSGRELVEISAEQKIF